MLVSLIQLVIRTFHWLILKGWDIQKDRCPVDCRFTVDRKMLHSADALLFDVCLTGPHEYREVYGFFKFELYLHIDSPIYFPEKRPGQKWIWFAYEQQYYFPMMQEEEYM